MAAYTTIDDPSAYFKVQLYTGNGSANHAITFDDTDTDMQPDFVWIKNTDATDSNCLFDSVRGATKVLHSDSNAAETTDADTLDSFASDGFQVDADVKVNTNTEKYVAWCWKESTTAGFDIITYTGNGSAQNIAHNLSAVPHFVMLFNRDATYDHFVWHKKLADNNALKLNTRDATSTYSHGQIDETTDASNVVLAQATTVNNVSIDGNDYLLYVFAPKQGFSKFGSYTGNGNADGTFIYTGFSVGWLGFRDTATSDFYVYDTGRDPINYPAAMSSMAVNKAATDQEGSSYYIDLLSNGFKIRTTNSEYNTAGNTYIYAAFAEAPLVNSNGVPCNAR